MVSKHSELLTLKPSSRFCDGYSQCDTKTKEKITTTCEKNQVCFFREDIAISAFNVTYDPLLLLSVSSTYAMTHALMSKNKQIVQVAHMETAGCINKNSTLSDKKLHADCEVDLKAELYDIKVKLNIWENIENILKRTQERDDLQRSYSCILTCETNNCNAGMDYMKIKAHLNECSIRDKSSRADSWAGQAGVWTLIMVMLAMF